MLSIRLFTGLSLPPDTIANLETLLGELQPLARIGWCHSTNLHITTKFIGDWEFARVPELSRLLLNMPREGKIPIEVSGLAFFGPALVAGIAVSSALQSLAARTDSALQILGIRPETRGYRPHVTLARIPGHTSLGQTHLNQLRDKAATLASESFGTFLAPNFHLYQSHLSVYRKLSTVPLA